MSQKTVDSHPADFADLDGRGCTWESRQTRLEGRDLAEWATATGIDTSNTEFVCCARDELLSF
jgi:hypothetical protein